MTLPVPVSVIILTLDEEEVVERAITSVTGFADEVVVVDSGSSDATVRIAEELGARIVHQPFLGWSPQRAVGIAAARNDWVFVLEADEVVSDRLGRAIVETFERGEPDPADGYSVDRRGDFLGILLPNSQRRSMVTGFVRLFHRDRSHYDDALVHERVVVPGRVRLLPGVLLHWRAATMADYPKMIDRYSDAEVAELERHGARPRPWSIVALPVVRFLYLYVVKREFLLGTRGLIHAMHRAFSDFLRHAKLWERAHAPRVVHPPEHLIHDDSTSSRMRVAKRSKS